MRDGLSRRIRRVATWPVVTLLFVGLLACSYGFQWRQAALGCTNKLLDGRLAGYGPEDVRSLLEKLEDGGPRLYAITEVSLDLVFPFVYGLLLAILIVRLWQPGRAAYLVILPWLAAAADLLENFTVAYLAWTFESASSNVAYVASSFTLLKHGVLVLALLAVLLGAVLSLGKPEDPRTAVGA